jgi:CheY-like chemotaxis protein
MANVLMLDDDEEALTWMTAALESRGHHVKAFSTARAALVALATYDPDLIVADVLMPEIDGLAFARIVRRRKSIPLLFVSIAKKEAEAVIAGAIGYVRKPASAAEVREAVDRVLRERDRTATILVVDDDADVRDLYSAYLSAHFETVTAANGKEALEVLRARRVDLAVVDVHMPVMNGAELVRAIREDPALQALPIIVQTSDLTAIKAPIWATLRVSQVMDKPRFVDWFEAQLRRPSFGEGEEHPRA